MNDIIVSRIKALRHYLQTNNCQAIIIPSNDSHFSEYTVASWKSLKWISGFTGSAGTVVVTLNKAALWTDSRYFIQAEKQLQGTGIGLMKMRMPETPSIENWLLEELPAKTSVLIDGKLFSVTEYERIIEALSPSLNVVAGNDPFSEIWKDRPALPASQSFLLPDNITGKSRTQKIKEVAELGRFGESAYLVTALDEVAWLLNMRGCDVHYNPVTLAYLIIDSQTVHLFIDTAKLSDNDKNELIKNNVQLHEYNDFDSFLSNYNTQKPIILNRNKVNIFTANLLKNRKVEIQNESIPYGIITALKACKNETEIEGFRKAMLIDGVAMVRYIMWLEENVPSKNITEIEAGKKLLDLRQQSPDFKGESFGVISAYGAHGASPHYSSTDETNVVLGTDSFYLVDSGGQYYYGSTDITRTLHFGNPSSAQKTDYTLVLKGMLRLSDATFPAGTRGSQLDALARLDLWQAGKNFMHGTGHGVGHFLNVHEGPQSIRMEENPVSLQLGMVTSNEPAVYLENKYGIRIENLICCQPKEKTAFGEFLCFETLTLCPIDTKCIDLEIFDQQDKTRLNNYHKIVYDKLSPLLNEIEKQWLKQKTSIL